MKETLLRDLETNSKQNGFLLAEHLFPIPAVGGLATLFGLEDYYKKLTAATIQEAARTYLDTNNYVKVTLFPETKASQDLLEDWPPRAEGRDGPARAGGHRREGRATSFASTPCTGAACGRALNGRRGTRAA